MDSLTLSLSVGIRLLFFRHTELRQIRFNALLFWQLAILSVLVSCLSSFLFTEAPRIFNAYALQGQGFWVSLSLLASFILSRMVRVEHLAWQLACLLMTVSILFDPIQHCLLWLLNRQYPGSYELQWQLFYGLMFWYFACLLKTLGCLLPYRRFTHRLGLSVLLFTVLTVPTWTIPYSQFWYTDYSDFAKNETEEIKPLDAEQLLFDQRQRLLTELQNLKPQRHEQPDLYLMSFGSDGGQDVFMSEARYVQQLFDEHFDTSGRSMALINNVTTAAETPLATVTNLRLALQTFSERMDKEEDILLLYLTSHGSEEHELSVSLQHLPLNGLSATTLKEILDSVAIKWKVIIISACYSGGFIEPLKDPYTLVMTSAQADRRSFGCSNEAEFTWFGRALFEQSLMETASFTEAFNRARLMVSEWEEQEGHTASLPQIYATELIEKQLQKWRGVLDAGSSLR